jgi:hypothetical protein
LRISSLNTLSLLRSHYHLHTKGEGGKEAPIRALETRRAVRDNIPP